MKRRKALKNIGLGVTAGLALPWLNSCSDDNSGPEIKYDGVVGIIGAGAAGLYAADYLLAKGIKVKIYEASPRIGGRVRAVRISDPIFSRLIADFPVELGADRIIGSDSELGNIVNLLRVPTIDFRGGNTNAIDKYLLDNLYKTYAEIQNDPDIVSLTNFKNNILPGYTGAGSVQTAAALPARVNAILNSWLGNPYGSSANRISAQALGEALSMIEHDGKELTLDINPLSDILLSRFSEAAERVQLQKAIESIDYSGDTISLSVKDVASGSVSTEVVNKLIVTVPISLLKSGDITFSPALPGSKTTAMSRIGMDASIRVILEFSRNDIFGADTAFIFGGKESPSAFLTGSGRSGVNGNRTFSFTINGPKAEELTGKTDLEKVQQILAELDAVTKADLVTPALYATRDVRKTDTDQIIYVVQDWTKEPYIKGGQSYPLVGGTNADRVELAAPVGESLYFAGEATDVTGEFGTINGALKSGKRAAEELITSITG
ncbi:MAG TPA: NAD(P)/FAD-dependent oxidoreductase [Cyclobacteriaceae bacterium]